MYFDFVFLCNLNPSLESFDPFHTVRPILYRQSRKSFPFIPHQIEDVAIFSPLNKTVQSERFLQINDGGHDKMLIFASRRHISELANSKRILCDGTFYAAPTLFRQMYTIHGEIHGHSFPLLYGFLHDKSRATYERFFRNVKSLFNISNLTIRWEPLIIDYEVAAHQAFREVFPNVEMKGCNFHFGKALWRNLQANGLSSVDKTIEICIFIDMSGFISDLLMLFREMKSNYIETHRPGRKYETRSARRPHWGCNIFPSLN